VAVTCADVLSGTYNIRPLVAALEIDGLTSGTDEHGVIVVSVPASPHAPHLLGERNEMGVPFRHGPHIEWMGEHQIERAYRDRFARAADDEAVIAALIAGVGPHLGQARGAWLVVAGHVLTPLPTVVERPPANQVRATLVAALELAALIYPHDQPSQRVSTLQQLGAGVNQPRVGLRRWVARSNVYAEPGVASDHVHVELHHDGSAVIAVCLNGWMRGEEALLGVHPVPTTVVESAVADAIAVIATHGRSRGHWGRMAARAAILRPDSDLPLGAVDNGYFAIGLYSGEVRLIPYSVAPYEVAPVDTEFAVDSTPAELRVAARQLVEDLLHQFAVQHLAMPQ
jgi:hypothetical protein